jgi:hypothetical protein
MAGRRNPRSAAAGHRGKNSTSNDQRVASSIRKLLEERDVIARIVQLAHDAYGLSALREAWDEFRCGNSRKDGEILLEFTVDSPFLEQFTSWLAHTWTPATLSDKPVGATAPDEVPTLTFLARHTYLDPLLSKYLEACVATPFSYFEVSKGEVGRRLNCCDLVYGTRHSVHESAAAKVFLAGQIMYARIVEVDGVSVIDAAGPWAIPEDRTPDLKPFILALSQDFQKRSSSGRERDLALRDFYWQFIGRASKQDSLRPQVQYGQSPRKAAERLSMMLAPEKTSAEMKPERFPQEILSITYVCEHWVNERLAYLGNRTALEAMATADGRLKVQALIEEVERRLGLFPASRLH